MRTIQEQNPLSIIIPALDAADHLPVTLSAWIAEPGAVALVREIVVADGGSADETVAIARAAGARIAVAPRGRGPQLAAGAAAASGSWLLFVHADCRPAAGWARLVGALLAAPDAGSRAGYFSFALDDRHPAARRIERLVGWRCRIFALPYGDQGLLITRALYDAVGGYAPLPLMEDVDLVRRLGRRRLAPLALPIYSSARRYRGGGYVRRPLHNLLCLSLYFAGLSPRRIARLYG